MEYGTPELEAFGSFENRMRTLDRISGDIGRAAAVATTVEAIDALAAAQEAIRQAQRYERLFRITVPGTETQED